VLVHLGWISATKQPNQQALSITYDPFAVFGESFFDKDREKLKKYSKLKRFV